MRQRKRFAFGERDSGFRRNGGTFNLLIKTHHSGESRNLRAEGAKFPVASRRRRFLSSQEWDGMVKAKK
ncbi:MAG: hypothetical protein ACR2QC_07270 [Gammaproteobacteria bacterium]